MWKAVRDKGVRFIGLDARHASPEGVRRLCCGEYGSDQIDGGNRTTWAPQCTLAIGDHDEHEDLATGVKWAAKQAPTMTWTYGTVVTIPSSVRAVTGTIGGTYAPAAGISVPAGAACPNCGGDDATCRGSLAGLKACAAKGAKRTVLDIASGKALDGLALLYDEKRRAGETCEDLRARLCGLRSRKDTGNGFRFAADLSGMRRAAWTGIEPALSPSVSSLVFGHRGPRSAEVTMRPGEFRCSCGATSPKHAESCAAPWWLRASSAVAWAELERTGDLNAAGKVGCSAFEGAGAVALLAWFCRLWDARHDARRQKEAALVALVAAVPEGLDPVGWRAAVLAEVEGPGHLTSSEASEFGAQVEAAVRGRDVMAFPHASAAYQRAIAPAPKVDRVRATWKTRGPVLPCDNGWDE